MSKTAALKKTTKKVSKEKTSKSLHKWRLCPAGAHWVQTHPMRIPPNQKNPTGGMTTRRGHCAKNPTGKDQLYPDEIQAMSHENFENVKGRPCPYLSEFKEKGSRYDSLIAGWTQYWNDVFNPENKLPPNVVKALIASESSFKPNLLANKKNSNSARGLMQITNDTRKILADEKGELKDHYLTLTKEDLNDPSNNICAGIRWLFRKKEVASALLKREATWEEAIEEFKGCRKATPESKQDLMKKYSKFFEELKECKK